MTIAAPSSAVLVADIGGTFARFGLAHGGRLRSDVLTLARSSARDLPDLCLQSLRHFRQAVAGGRARMTNVDWEVDEQALAQALSLERVLLLNDFAALACSLPALEAGDVLPVPPRAPLSAAAETGETAASDAPRVVFGPGTGLGVAALLQYAGHAMPR